MFANRTGVRAAPQQDVPIESVAVGDAVLAAGPSLAWAPAAVQFSSGTAPGTRATLVRVRFDGGEVIAAVDGVLVLTGGKLIRAAQLVAGAQLLAMDGSARSVLEVSIGSFDGGVHHVATSSTPASSLEGHLLDVDGLVVGDYALQLAWSTLPADLKATPPPAPAPGTVEYRLRAAAPTQEAPAAVPDLAAAEAAARQRDLDLTRDAPALHAAARAAAARPLDDAGAATQADAPRGLGTVVVTFRAPGADTPIDLSRLPAESYELVYPAGVARLATVVGPDARFTRLTDAPATVELRLHDPDARASVSYTAELPPCTPG